MRSGGSRSPRPAPVSAGAPLPTQPQLVEDLPVAVGVLVLEVFQQPAALADQLEQAAPGVVVLLVSLEVLGQPGDPLAEQRDLDLGGPGVRIVQAVGLDD